MYSPFWSFFDTINDEVEQFNRLLASNGYENRVKTSPRNSKEKEMDASKQVSYGERPKRTDDSLVFPTFSSIFRDSEFGVIPPIDILDHETNFELHVSIPGVPKNNINLDFNPDKNEFKISGEIPGHKTESTNKLRVKERSSGKFERTITLPPSTKLDEENIKATYENGVLVLIIPKLEKTQSNSRRIMISSSDASSSSEETTKQ